MKFLLKYFFSMLYYSHRTWMTVPWDFRHHHCQIIIQRPEPRTMGQQYSVYIKYHHHHQPPLSPFNFYQPSRAYFPILKKFNVQNTISHYVWNPHGFIDYKMFGLLFLNHWPKAGSPELNIFVLLWDASVIWVLANMTLCSFIFYTHWHIILYTVR